MLLTRGDYAGAAGEYRQALSENLDDPRAHYNLGLCLQALGSWKEALDEYVAAETLEPKQPLVLHGRAMAEIHVGLRDEAARTIDRLCALEPDSPECDEARRGLASLAGSPPPDPQAR